MKNRLHCWVKNVSVSIGLLFCVFFFVPGGNAVSAQLGLSNDGQGGLLLEGKSYKGVGINYYDGFMRRLIAGSNTTYEAGFQSLHEHHVPFVRVPIMAYWPSQNLSYFDEVHSGTTNKYTGEPNSTYFSYLDDFIACAETNNVGLILDFFWYCYTVGDMLGEPANAIGNSSSYTRSFQNTFVQEIITRYKDSPAVWAWEFGNEYNNRVDIPGQTPDDLPTVTAYGQPAVRTVDDLLHTEDLQPALSNFAWQVRLCDTNRLAVTGNAVPRSSAWNLYDSEQWIVDSEQEAMDITDLHSPFPCDTYSGHVYDPVDYYQQSMSVTDNYIEYMSRAGAFEQVFYAGEFGAFNTMTENEQLTRWDENFDAIVDLEVSLSSAWVYDFENGTGIDIRSDNTNAWILDEIALATRALNTPACTNQDIGTTSTAGWITDNWRNGNKWIRNASGYVYPGSESGHFVTMKDGLSEDGVITAHLAFQSNTAEWCKSGLMIREDMSDDSRMASLLVASYAPGDGRAYFSRRDAAGSNSVSDIAYAVAAPQWLRLRKVGDGFDAYYKATENSTWQELGNPVNISGMETDNEIGWFASSQAGTGAWVMFDSVEVQQWTAHAVGIPATNALAQLDETNGFYLVGSGGFYPTNDACCYYCLDGGFNQDAEAVVEVTGVDNTSDWAAAGIMVRNGLGTGSQYVSVMLAPHAPSGGRVYFKRRTEDGETYDQDLVAGVGTSRWLKLRRDGNLFSVYQSSDGDSWTQIGSDQFISMPVNLEIGLITASYSGSTARGFFDHFEVEKIDVYSE